MTVKDDWYGYVRIKGKISKDVFTSAGGLVITTIMLINRDKSKAFKTYVPVAWFGRRGKDVAADFEKGDVVNIDAQISMNKARKGQCPSCGTVFQPKDYYPQIVGDKIQHIEITGTPPDPVDNIEEEGNANE